MAKLSIFLGDLQGYLGEIAKKYDDTAWLLDSSNYKTLDALSPQDTTVYTSISDLPKDLSLVYQLLNRADKIFYCPPDRWSDRKTVDVTDTGSCLQGLTERLLFLLPDRSKIVGYPQMIHDPIPLVDSRKTDHVQLWIAGCSISHGIGVNTEQRYGALLAKELDLPCSFLTRPGSSIDWAADQILRSDIRENDLVVWGLTNSTRFSYIHDHKLLEGISIYTYDFHPEYKKIVDPSNLFSHQTYYRQYYAIKHVINFCKTAKARLLLVGILSSSSGLLPFLSDQESYVHIPRSTAITKTTIGIEYADLGTDNMHPGPKQHQEYKEMILAHINKKTL